LFKLNNFIIIINYINIKINPLSILTNPHDKNLSKK